MDEPHILARPRPEQQQSAEQQGTLTRRRRRRILPWIILLLVVAAISWALLRPKVKTTHPGSKHAAVTTAQPVTVGFSRTGDMPVMLTELGTVTSLANVTVQSQISGYLTQVNFQEGQEVHRGDQLALIDPRPYEATRDQYQGQLARDTASLNQARTDLARYQGLKRQHSIAEQQVADQVYLVAQDEGAVQIDQAQVESAKLNIAYCHIKAPVDGRVGLRQVDAGNYVTPGLANGLVVLTMLHPISVIFSVPEDEIDAIHARLAAGAVLPVAAYDRTNTTLLARGHVAVLDNVVDTATGTVKLRAIFDNANETLFPNQFVNARLLVDTLHNVVLVPTSAVQTGPQGQFVYVVPPDNKVQVRNVTPGLTSTDDTVIASGLAAGVKVVTDGTEHLRSGSEVMVPTPPKAGQQGHANHAARGKGAAPPT
ncbi:MdtA/MuxA family multidrug efflux RND transporter periplasmic adaptor subunit [Lichenicoccus sp.]|uniref:MdtA/MuxA family multidrug efflux RND transporter periplasmic adaptor subunit n=1 Tax=Lichenicoccus sp. TaxID=2781899 RepID=UPI003D12B856